MEYGEGEEEGELPQGESSWWGRREEAEGLA